jgi:eukaryotic-like serine/threonine-protein kinase
MDHQQQIGHFAILDELGSGTVGQVFRARNVETNEIVALKLLRGSVVHEPEIEQRFVREVTVLQQLDHPNIVRYDFCGLHKDNLFFTMEQVDSGTLKEVLSGPMPWRDCVEVAIQVCSALEHAHQKGIVHRDLKPGNLFLSDAGEVKLGDFGIALDVDNTRLTLEGDTVGTIRYMAPEQFTDSDVDERADLYSLGCVLFQMLTFYVPYDGKLDIEVMQGHTDSPVPSVCQLVPGLSQQLDDLVRKLLAKNPDDRPSSATEAREAFEKLLHGAGEASDSTEKPQADESESPNLTERLKSTRHSTGDKVSWIGVAVIGAVIVVGLIVYSVVANQ